MLSFRARLFLFLLRNRHLLRLNFRKETGEDWLHGLPKVREAAAKSSALMGRLPEDIVAQPADLGALRAEWIRPRTAAASTHPDEAILYFHGGGYVLGTIEAHRGIVAKFVKAAGVGALLFEYRLAPEHPYPAALEDALAAYRWLLHEGYWPERVLFMGDSAGAGLSLATLLALRDEGRPLPAGAVALSPWTDLANTGESLRTNAHLCLAPKDSWVACATHYVGDNDPTDPHISPLYGDLRGLPPLLLFCGADETLRDDSIRFADKARQAGVDVTLRVGERLCHCYPACAPIFPEATAAMAEIGAFARRRLGRGEA